MNRIEKKFQEGPAFIGYITAGDGGLAYSIQACLALAAGGVDLLEIGVPFSDPVADGPVIQAASQRALAMGATPDTVLRIIEEIRKRIDIPIILFSYLNPVLQSGPSFFQEVQKVGGDGILLLDLPLEEGIETFAKIKQSGLAPVMIATPSTSEKRLDGICEQAEGFIYYVCQKGTTGMRSHLPSDFVAQVGRIKSCTNIPVAAGFGISTREMAREALTVADAFVVGSAIVDVIGKGGKPEDLRRLAEQIDPRC